MAGTTPEVSESRFQFSAAELTDEYGGLDRTPFLILCPVIAGLWVIAGLGESAALLLLSVVLLALVAGRLRNLGSSIWQVLIPLTPIVLVASSPGAERIPGQAADLETQVLGGILLLSLLVCLVLLIRLFAGPAGYADHKKMDGPGKVIALAFGVFVVLVFALLRHQGLK